MQTTFFLLFVLLILAWMARARQQRQRIALLAGLLSPYGIEKHMETVSQGYQRALGEADPHRREQVLQVLRPSEEALARQMGQLADAVGAADAAALRVSRLPMWTPAELALGGTFDLREALRIHARGIGQAVQAEHGTPARDRAFAILAELLLMQHTCHWFCRSKTVASARLQARHRTRYEQVLDAVLPATRAAYLQLVAPRAAP